MRPHGSVSLPLTCLDVRWLCALTIVYALMTTLFANRCALELLLYELYCYSAYTLVHVVCIFIHQPPPPERVDTGRYFEPVDQNMDTVFYIIV